MEVARAVLGVMAEVFAPVGAIADGRMDAEDRAAVACQVSQRGDGGINRGAAPHPGQPDHLRADQEAVDPSGQVRQSSVVEDQAAEAPFVRAVVGDRAIVHGEVAWRGGSEEGGDLIDRRRGLVWRSRLSRRRMAGDPPAPGIGGLLGSAVGIGQAAAGRHVHHHERIQAHLQSPPLQLGDGLDHGVVAGRAAIGGAAVHGGDQVRVAAVHPARAPFERQGELGLQLHARPDGALAAAQVVAEPGDHQADLFHVRQLGLKLVQRHHDVRPPVGVVDVLRRRAGDRQPPLHALRGVDELARAGDHAHRLQSVLQRALAGGAAEHLEGQLRRPVSVRAERQVLEHHIGRPSVGGSRTFHRLDQGVGALILRSRMNAHDHAGHVHRLAISPHPAHAVDRPLAQGHGEGEGVVVVDALGPALAAARAGDGAAFGKAGGPDDLPGDPRPAEHRRHGRALGAGLQLQPVQARPLAGGGQGGDQRAVGGCPQRRSDGRADRPADRGADAGEDDLGHVSRPRWGRRNGRRGASATMGRSSSPRRRGPSRRGSSAPRGPRQAPPRRWRRA